MIPFYRLEKLPRTQQLRKIAKYFYMAETRLCAAKDGIDSIKDKACGIFSVSELEFFAEAAKRLAADSLFPSNAQKMFAQAVLVFGKTAVPAQELRRALNSVKHILLATIGKDQADWDFVDSDGKLDQAKRRVFKGMHLYLEDIRSPFNVGAIFRTAESFGVEKIILSPFCADPKHKRAERTAMGCVDIVPWERRELFPPASVADWPDNNITLYPVFALETGGIPLSEFTFPPSGILVAGSEELGVSPRALEAADASLGRVSIPCYGAKASLNVSVAAGIALQAWAAKCAAR